MNVKTNAEKEWLHKLTNGQPTAKEEVKVPQRAAEAQPPTKEPKKNGCHGFADVAGIDELKLMVKEGFINVLNNRECAKAFGITPPSLLFYGPAGCGKTFFAEKIAEEEILKVDPFQVLDQKGVGKLIKYAVEKGREIRPELRCGICGEHGGEPSSVKFCAKIGMNYASCSPFRVPIARLAAAQAAVEE